MKLRLLLLFLILNFPVYFLTETNMQQREQASLLVQLHKLEINKQVFLKTQAINADMIFQTAINTKRVKQIFKEASVAQGTQREDELREALYEELKEKYKAMQADGVLQLQLVYANNKSFLRMHKASKYADNLENIREDFANVNATHTIIRGFSKGKTAHAFRNIYPIFDENEYLGAVEISYPSELLQSKLNDVSETFSHFLVKKNVFTAKYWERDDTVLKYEQSHLHDDYLLTKTNLNNEFMQDLNINKRLDALHEEIDENIRENKKFALSSNYNGEIVIISFLPISQGGAREASAWIVSYEENTFLNRTLVENKIIRVVSLIVTAFMMFFLYRMLAQKKKLNEIVELYNKNVIFSTTDTKGIITHVSDAFCEISGYTKDDLVGKPHSLMRHTDMHSGVFDDLWHTIEQGKTWKGEIKNFKKDGGYYWSESEIEAIYKDGKIIGFSSIRHDITHRKELDTVQKDIIYTMGTIGENRSLETGQHVKRVALYSRLFARKYGLSKEKVETLYQASPMHDIGKIAIPDAILNKPGALDTKEMAIMKTHAKKGYEMLSVSSQPLLQAAAIVAYHHHEKWDGSGYPRGLMKKEIDIFGRITAIADVFDALGSDRCYKKAWDDEKIFALLKEQSGKHFEPRLVEIFFENLDEFLSIRDRFK